MKRSAFLTASSSFAVVPLAVVGQALTKIVVGCGPTDSSVAALWGVQSGAFRRAGLDVDVQRAASGPAVAAAVAGGALDMGSSTMIPLLLARAKGFPFVLIAPGGIYSAESPTGGMIAAKDSPLKTGRDCVGKTIGVTALNDLTNLGAVAWVDSTGGDSKSLRFVEVPFPAMAEAVAAGRIDAGALANPFFEQGIQSGKVRLLSYCYSAIARRFMESGFFATRDYIAKNKEAVAAFRRAIYEAAAYANEHRDKMAPLVSNFTGIPTQTLLEQRQHFVGTSLDPRLIQPLVDAAMKYKAITGPVDARAMIDPDAL